MMFKQLFFSNLYELRIRLLYCMLTFTLNFIISASFFEEIVYMMASPILKHMNSPRFSYSNLVDVFYINIMLSSYISLFCFICLILVNIILFLTNGLYIFEQKSLKKLVIYNFIFLSAMTIMIYHYLVPFIWQCFLGFEKTGLFPLHFEAQIKLYIEFLLYILSNGFLLIESLFILFWCFFLLKDIINLNFLRKRKSIYIFFLLLSTIVTPPDIASQIFLTIIFIIIFEVYLFFLLYYFKLFEMRQAERKTGLK